jgi:hypothetical protein
MPEPVQKKQYENTIYYVFSDGDEPQWQESPEGGFIVALFEYNSDGTSHLTIVDGNEVHTEYIIATASYYVGKAVKTGYFNIPEIEYVDRIYR